MTLRPQKDSASPTANGSNGAIGQPVGMVAPGGRPTSMTTCSSGSRFTATRAWTCGACHPLCLGLSSCFAPSRRTPEHPSVALCLEQQVVRPERVRGDEIGLALALRARIGRWQ